MIVLILTVNMEQILFLIRERVKQYIALGNDLQTTNWLDFAKSIGTQDYFQVQEELNKYKFEE